MTKKKNKSKVARVSNEDLAKRQKYVIISNLTVIVLLAGVLYVLVGLATQVDEDSFQCIHDPLGYGAKKLTEVNEAEFSCTCSLAKPNSPLIYFDSQEKNIIYVDEEQFPTRDYTFNISTIFQA